MSGRGRDPTPAPRLAPKDPSPGRECPPSEAPVSPLPGVSRRRTVTLNAALLYLNIALTLVQGIALVPIYLRLLPISLYGAWLATGNLIGWIELVDPGLSTVLQQRTAFRYGEGDTRALGRTIGTGLLLGCAMSTLPLFALPVARWVPGWFHITSSSDAHALTMAFAVALVSLTLALASYVVMAVNIGLQLIGSTGFIHTVSIGISVAVTVAGLVGGLGVVAIPLGLLARNVLMFAANLARLVTFARRQHLRLSGTRGEVGVLGKMMGYTFVVRLAVALTQRVELLLAARLVSPAAAAVLVITGKASEVVSLLASRIGISLSPAMSHLLGEGKRVRFAQLFGLVGRYQGAFMAVASAGVVALNLAFVSVWVGPSNFGGRALTFAIVLASGLAVLNSSVISLLIAAGEVRSTSRVTLLEALFRLPLQIVLVWRWGLIGVPLATIASSSFVAGSALARTLREMFADTGQAPEREWLRSAATYVAMAVAGLLASQLFAQQRAWSWPRFGLAALACGVAMTGLFALLRREVVRDVAHALRHRTRSHV